VYGIILALALLQQPAPPNVVIILADDLGYGDIHAYQPESPIPTPNLDQLAADGMRFTDAHSGSAVCTPTRYGLMTGRYCWRSRLKRGVLAGYSKHLIEPTRPTVASVLQQAGYHTACIGKWHLGMDLPRDGKQMDWQGTISNGPNAVGFDFFWGVTASLDFPPYVWVENQSFAAPADQHFEGGKFPGYLRAGEIANGFVHQQALDQITAKAVQYIGERAAAEQPFFLYLPLTAPHKPVLPAERFRGKSGIGPYGDFVMQTDWVVGQVDQALAKHELTGNTVVIVSSDNGSFMYRLDAPESPHRAKQAPTTHAPDLVPPLLVDHSIDPTVHGYLTETHRANGALRGTKADIWDGGHRVPLLVRWPGKIKAAEVSDQVVSLVDVMATCVDAAGATLPAAAAEDSQSLLPLLRGSNQWKRQPVIQHSANGTFAIRDGRWKLIDGRGAGGRGKRTDGDLDLDIQLYDMTADLGERRNLAADQAEVVERLMAELRRIQSSSTRPIKSMSGSNRRH
jgi:arylsulfatase A